jgi:hypothetical protein
MRWNSPAVPVPYFTAPFTPINPYSPDVVPITPATVPGHPGFTWGNTGGRAG